MAIPFPQILPWEHPLLRMEFVRNDGVAIAASPFTGQQQYFSWGAEFWSVTVAWPARRRDIAQQMDAVLASLRGPGGPVLIGSRLRQEPLGLAATAAPIVVDGALATGATAVPIRGAVPDVTGVFKAGDLFQLGTAELSRLHMALGDVDLDAQAKGVIDAWPGVREAQVDGAAIVISKPVGTFSLATTTAGWTERDRIRTEVSPARFIEFLPIGSS